jgi:hypothetical protein
MSDEGGERSYRHDAMKTKLRADAKLVTILNSLTRVQPNEFRNGNRSCVGTRTEQFLIAPSSHRYSGGNTGTFQVVSGWHAKR